MPIVRTVNLVTGLRDFAVILCGVALLPLCAAPPVTARQGGTGRVVKPRESTRRTAPAAGRTNRRRTPPLEERDTPPATVIDPARTRLEEAISYLVEARGIDEGRIVVLDAGCRNNTVIELWVVPRGATGPAAKSSQPCAPSARLEDLIDSSGLFVKTAYRPAAASDIASRAAQRQGQAQAQCPYVRVSCLDTAAPRQPVTFTAEVSGGDPSVTPTYNWTVSAGTISSGQGTPTIMVDTTGVTGPVTATVDVGGYDRSCTTSVSCTTNLPPRPEARKFDFFGPSSSCSIQIKLDAFAIELQRDPTAAGYIVFNARLR